MKERILEFLRRENKTSAQFAEEIGVQPSGISHIISGRNNPSLDFVLKMLERYSYISTEWLLFGKGNMYRDQHYGSLFDVPAEPGIRSADQDTSDRSAGTVQDSPASNKPPAARPAEYDQNMPAVDRIVWFYDDGSFEEFFRRN